MSTYSLDRTNAGNTGKWFEHELEITAGGYQSRRIATLRKVDPPVRVVGSGFNRKMIFLANPFLDYVGTWRAHGGRAIFFEAKSTATHRLPFERSGGLTAEQVAAIWTWHASGAVAFLVWKWADRVAVFLPRHLETAAANRAKSLVFEDGIPVVRGEGSVIWDFLAAVEMGR